MSEILNWVSMIEIPIFLALFKTVMKLRKEAEVNVAMCKDGLSEFKLYVAQNYASMNYLKDVENRLTNHLLRIEKKLDEVGRNKQ